MGEKGQARRVAQDVKSFGCDLKTGLLGLRGEGGVRGGSVRNQQCELPQKAACRVTTLPGPPPPPPAPPKKKHTHT